MDGSKQNPCCHGARFSMQNDGIFLREFFKMWLPQGHIVEAQFAKRGVKINFQTGGFRCKSSDDIGVVGSRAEKLSIITTRFFFRSIQSDFESRLLEYRRFCIWHGEDHRHAAGEGSLCGSVPVFFVSLPRFANVNVW